MVRGQIFSKKHLLELDGKDRERDEYIEQRLNAKHSELIYVRSCGAGINGVHAAAEFIYSKTHDPSHLTQYNIAAVFSSDWKNPESKSSIVSKYIIGKYKRRAGRYASIGLYPPYIELFRCDVTGKDVPFVKERKKWKKFVPSRDDWLRSVRLPMKMNEEETELIGIYWPHANLSIVDDSYYLKMSGSRESDIIFYREEVEKRIKEVHNLKVETEVIKEGERISRNLSKYPQIEIDSQAVVTWMRDDMMFPENNHVLYFPNLESRRQRYGFFTGIVACMGQLSEKGLFISTWETIPRYNVRFLRLIENLAKDIGFTPRHIAFDRIYARGRVEKHHTLYFSPNEVKRMKFINPLHQKNKP
jgi:hypothetical protein